IRRSICIGVQSLQRRAAATLIVQGTIDQAIEASHLARSADGDQFDLAGVARLETHGGAGRNVETHAVGRGAVEAQRAIDLEEMKVRTDLNRAVAAVAHLEPPRLAAGVQLDGVGTEEVFAWDHDGRLWAQGSW